MSKYIFLVLLSFGFCEALPAQEGYFNKSYEKVDRDIEVVITPIGGDFALSDSTVKSIFVNNRKIEFQDFGKSKELVFNDNKLLSILNKIASKEFKKKEIKQFPNLKNELTADEFKYIKSKFKDADYLLIPVVFEVTNMGNIPKTFGNSVFRLYDLHTGQFILWYKASLNVNVGENEGVILLSKTFLGMVKGYIDENL